MKQSQKDEILQIAFGETNDSARIEELRETSPQSIREIESLRNIKLNLQQLPVPECQLSTERLRDAILNTGLDERAKVSQPMWKFVWMPVVVLAVAVLGTQMIRNNRTIDPVLTGSLVVTEKGPDVAIDFNPSGNDLFPELPFDETVLSNEPAAPSPVNRVNRRSSNSSRGGSVRLVADSVPEPTAKAALTAMESVAVAMPAGLGGGGGSASPATLSPAEDSSNSGIVLIGSDRDTMTGANKAIEVTDTSTMVTGG